MATRLDLETLGLSAGKHIITAVATATGYRPSEHSNAVTYIIPYTESIVIQTGTTVAATAIVPHTLTIQAGVSVASTALVTHSITIQSGTSHAGTVPGVTRLTIQSRASNS